MPTSLAQDPECCAFPFEPKCTGMWDDAAQQTTSLHHEGRAGHLCPVCWTCARGQPSTTEELCRWRSPQRQQMLPCRAARQHCGTRSHSQKVRINAVAWQTRSARKNDAHLWEFLRLWTLRRASNVRLTMGFRNPDATEAVQELWVRVRCIMTAPHQRVRLHAAEAQSKVGQHEPGRSWNSLF